MKAEERQSLNKQIVTRIGVYGFLKRNQFVTHLSDRERDELDLLEVSQDRSPAQEERFDKLWDKASRGYHQEKERLAAEPPDTFFDEIRVRMWAKHEGEQGSQ